MQLLMNITDLKTSTLEQACKDFQIKELYVFGSVVSDTFSDDSDLDFLFKFDRIGYQGAFEQYPGFKEQLEKIYQLP